MDSKQFVETIRRRFSVSPIPAREALLTARIVLHDLVDNLHRLRLANGGRILDQIDFSTLLHEIEAAIELDELIPSKRFFHVCHSCGHSHASGEECQENMGGAGICGCKAEVPA